MKSHNPNVLAQALRKHFPDAQGVFPEFRICCPECGDRRYRLGINVKKPTGHCFNCGERFNLNSISELLKIDNFKFYEPTDFNSLEDSLRCEKSPKLDFEASPEIISEWCPLWASRQNPDYSEDFEKACAYILDRGFSPKEFAIDYDVLLAHPKTREAGRIVFPVYEEGRLVYFQARSFKNAQPKYLNPSKLQTPKGKSDFVWNLDRASKGKHIVICEGIFSAISVGEFAVAIFGKELSNSQVSKILLSGVESATILLDPDAKKSAKNLAVKLYPKISVSIANIAGGDPNEVNSQEIERCIQEADPFEDPLFDPLG